MGTFLAGFVAVIASFMFPVSLQLVEGSTGVTPPEGVVEVLKTLMINVVDNPIHALANANYIGILSWTSAILLALKNAPSSTKVMITNFSDALFAAVSEFVKWRKNGKVIVFQSIKIAA